MSPEKEISLNKALDRVCNIGWGLESDELLETCYAANAMIVGTTADELFFDLDGIRTLIRRQKEQTEGMELQFTRKPIFRNISGDENVAVIVETVTVVIRVNSETISFDIRSSAIMEYMNGEWKLIHWHASKPEMVQSDVDTFGIEDWKQKTDALEKLVAERTADLIIKNRELEIESALDKVRTKTMAMQHSNELAEASFLLDSQIRALGIHTRGCAFNIYGDNESTEWFSSAMGTMPTYKTPRENCFLRYYEAGKAGEKIFVNEFAGQSCADHYAYLCTIPIMGDALKEMIRNGGSFPERQIDHIVYFKYGYLLFITLEPVPEAHDIFIRFANVFEQTYTRFLDLQKAEAQSREAQVQLALERVRARTMAMQRSNELADTASVLLQQIKWLGFETWSCGFCTWQDDDLVELWMGAEAGGLLPPMRIPYRQEPTHKEIYLSRQRNEALHEKIWNGKELDRHYDFLRTIPSVAAAIEQMKEAGLSLPDQQCYYAGFFSSGYLLLITKEPNPQLSFLCKRFATVFDQTYTRFLDLQKAEAQALQAAEDLVEIKSARQKAEAALMELQQTQKQLIQSEKMASLGELTAGIAHEIQNPLNFVNNFSDVSKELIDEMKTELAAGNASIAIGIANDLIQNLEKIHHHGKRADSIVKGMLQHSRISNGQKEPADPNALCEEYLRLAYHGLRAKDNSFQTTINTDFDQSIGKIQAISQDLGRVIMNLLNNSFYAVNEKAKQGDASYSPAVMITTKKLADKIEIKIADNGNGIPDAIKEKIFQPFFTTKPTGQGTGLGLSLSYDIVKAHGGEIRVDSKKSEGTIFCILLPGQS